VKSVEQIEKQLKAPFNPCDIEWRIGSTSGDKTRGLALAYVTNRAIMNRLDEVFGIAGWRNEYTDWKGKGVLCGITCQIGSEWLTKWDGAEETNMESTKGGLSDAMKRAGYQWGIGRYLYNLVSQWVPIEQRGKSYFIKSGQEPKLPVWALPEGYKYEDLANNAITKKQQEELFAVSKGKEEQAKVILTKYGYKMSKDIQQDHFKDICEEIRRATNA